MMLSSPKSNHIVVTYSTFALEVPISNIFTDKPVPITATKSAIIKNTGTVILPNENAYEK